MRDRYRRTFEVNSVSGTCLTGYAADGTSAKLESFHSTKVFKLYRVVRDGKEILVTVPEKEAL